jgi:Fic/DOC family
MGYRISRDDLLELISRFPDGASLEEILVGVSPPIARRTLQRHLLGLVADGLVTPVGKARARRYRIAKAPKGKPSLGRIPLSSKGKKIQSKILQPIQMRKPIGYHREFLEDYRPNDTFYLTLALRKKLAKIGGSGDGNYPAGTSYAKQIFHRLLIDLSWNSSRLEGNTYSLLETQRLLELGKAAEGKNLKETQMIINHKAAIEFLIQSAGEIGVNRFTILNLHTLLSENLLSDPAACGRLRSFPVGIEKSTYLPIAIPQVIEECFDLLIAKAKQIHDPFEQAFFLMVHLPYLQPFDDVNKRTSRLALNIPLIRNNLCPMSFIDVPQDFYINALLGVYELNRTGFCATCSNGLTSVPALSIRSPEKVWASQTPSGFNIKDKSEMLSKRSSEANWTRSALSGTCVSGRMQTYPKKTVLDSSRRSRLS